MTEKSRLVSFIAVFIISISSCTVLYFPQRNSVDRTNPGSRYAAVEALVDYRTFYIDKTLYAKKITTMGHDSVLIDGHYYSSKPPMLSVLTAGVYWIYKSVTGNTIRYNRRSVAMFCNRVMAGIPHILLLVFFFRFTRLITQNDEAVLAGLGAVCFSFIGAGYATSLNNHSPAAAVLLIGFYYAYRIRNEIDAKQRHWEISGYFCGFLPTLELPALFISIAVGLYLLFYDWKKTIKLFIPAALVPILIHFILTYVSTGSVLPVYLRSDLYFFEGSYYSTHYEIYKALVEPKHIYLFHMLFGHHGIFSMTPTLIFAVLALVRIFRKRSALLPEALVVSVSGVILIIFYTMMTENYGGKCVGFRWLIVLTPLLFLFFAVWIDTQLQQKKLQDWMLIILLVTFLIGQYHTLDASRKPWKTSRWQKFIEKTFKNPHLQGSR